jgi:hypothetical protein
MRCPYCASELPEEAIVCAQCRRDLYLVKPLQERIEQLQAELTEQAKSIAAGYQTRLAALEQEVSTLRPLAPAASASRPRSYWASALLALLPALILLLAAHSVLLFIYDVKPLYLRIASVMIPIPFGFALLVWNPRRMGISAIAGFIMALAAVFLMLVVTARVDNVQVLPQDPREVREVLEYVASIGLAFLTGLLLGKLRHHRLSIAPRPNRAVVFLAQLFTTDKEGELGIERMANRIQRLSAAATPAVTGAAAVYAGVKVLLGDGS